MKQLLKQLNLLRNYPTVWRTRIHIVLPLALLAFPVLFAAGCFLPKNTFLEPLVHPIDPIEITQGNSFLIPFAFAVIAVLYWVFTQYQYKFDDVKPIKVVGTLLMYGIGLFVILGLDTIAFRLGTIAWTTQLMDKEDLELVESKDYFLYGFISPFIDSIRIGQENTFFEQDTTFKYVCRYEDSILVNNYNWLYRPYRSKLLNLSYRSYLSDRSYLSSLSNKSYLLNQSYRLYRSYRSYLSNLLYQSYSSYLSDLSDRSYLSDLSDLSNLSDLSFLSYRSYLSDQSYLSNRLNRLLQADFYDSKLLSSYDNYYTRKDSSDKSRIRTKYQLADYDTFYISTYMRERIDTIRLKLDSLAMNDNDLIVEVNALKEKLDTVKVSIPELSFYLPHWFYQLEDGVRSIRHANEYFKQKIIYRYLKMALSYLPFILMLFFLFPYLLQRTFLGMLLLVGLFVFLGNLQYGETVQIKYDFYRIGESEITYKIAENELPYGLHKEKFLSYCTMGLSTLSLLVLLVLTFFRKHEQGISIFLLQLFILAATATAIIPFFIENKNEYLEELLPNSFKPYFNEDFLYYPKTWVFYLTAAMCLAPVLFSYLKGLPKSR